MDNLPDSPLSPEAEKIFIHDLSSPMMIAMGWLERWMRRDPSVLEVEEFCKINVQLERLQTLVMKRREEILELQGLKK